MAKAIYDEQAVADIAAAIREKNQTSNTYTVAEMSEAIKQFKIASEESSPSTIRNYYTVDIAVEKL